jgi:hypothetical protein
MRAAAARFTVNPDDAAWLSGLAEPRIPEWQIEQEETQRVRALDRAIEWQKHTLRVCRAQVGASKRGIRLCREPRESLLKLFHDMGDQSSDGPARLVEWLGEELKADCIAGFEAFLLKQPPLADGRTIAQSHAESRHWEAAYVLVAALAGKAQDWPRFR